MNEPWLCANCNHTGPLSTHGRCESCDSESVMPAVVLRQEVPRKKRKYTRRATQRDIKELERILSL